jgi:hypothetical protein
MNPELRMALAGFLAGALLLLILRQLRQSQRHSGLAARPGNAIARSKPSLASAHQRPLGVGDDLSGAGVRANDILRFVSSSVALIWAGDDGVLEPQGSGLRVVKGRSNGSNAQIVVIDGRLPVSVPRRAAPFGF